MMDVSSGSIEAVFEEDFVGGGGAACVVLVVVAAVVDWKRECGLPVGVRGKGTRCEALPFPADLIAPTVGMNVGLSRRGRGEVKVVSSRGARKVGIVAAAGLAQEWSGCDRVMRASVEERRNQCAGVAAMLVMS